jgi:hypothetical protein
LRSCQLDQFRRAFFDLSIAQVYTTRLPDSDGSDGYVHHVIGEISSTMCVGSHGKDLATSADSDDSHTINLNSKLRSVSLVIHVTEPSVLAVLGLLRKATFERIMDAEVLINDYLFRTIQYLDPEPKNFEVTEHEEIFLAIQYLDPDFN